VTAVSLRDRDAWMRAILASGEHETVQRVGLRIALYIHMQTGRCNPACATIARDLGGIAERTVQRAIKTLEQHGWIRVERTSGGRQDGRRGNTNDFVLCHQALTIPNLTITAPAKLPSGGGNLTRIRHVSR
jgi:hypothetical protein